MLTKIIRDWKGLHIYNACVKSGSNIQHEHTRLIQDEQLERLDAFHRQQLGSLLGIQYPNIIHNQDASVKMPNARSCSVGERSFARETTHALLLLHHRKYREGHHEPRRTALPVLDRQRLTGHAGIAKMKWLEIRRRSRGWNANEESWKQRSMTDMLYLMEASCEKHTK